MSEAAALIDADALCAGYLATMTSLMRAILNEEREPLDRAAGSSPTRSRRTGWCTSIGPGGHSNLAAQEMFFRAGGLMHIAAILDEGTLLSNGALRSMAIERTPGYGRIVIADRRLGEDDLLILVNAYGINAALIDAALEARRRGVVLIGVSSRRHAANTRPTTPPAIRRSRICTMSSTSPSTPRCRSATPSCRCPAWPTDRGAARPSPMPSR